MLMGTSGSPKDETPARSAVQKVCRRNEVIARHLPLAPREEPQDHRAVAVHASQLLMRDDLTQLDHLYDYYDFPFDFFQA